MKTHRSLTSIAAISLLGLNLLSTAACSPEGQHPPKESAQPCAGGELLTDSSRTDWWYRQEESQSPDEASFHTGGQIRSNALSFPPEDLDPSLYIRNSAQRYESVFSLSGDEIQALPEGEWITPNESPGQTKRRTNIHTLEGNVWETQSLILRDDEYHSEPIELCRELTDGNSHGMDWYVRSKER